MSKDPSSTIVKNPWSQLRQLTSARIALGRCGTSLPTKPHLEFQLAHARARNAVHHELNATALQRTLHPLGHDVVVLQSAAESRPVYLQRPDKGRLLSEAAREKLKDRPSPAERYDVVFVIGDGLSALAIEENAAIFLEKLLPSIRATGWRVGPIAVVTEARVAVGDEVGGLLGADLVVVLIGERPGLSSPDSMGIYMTFKPCVGVTDESRNCISNVRAAGLSHEIAAHKLLYLMTEAKRRGYSGVLLKDEAEALPSAVTGSAKSFLIDTE